MFACQISNALQVTLRGYGKAVERLDVALVELVVFVQKERLILVDTKFDLLLSVKDRVYPIAVIHIHWVDIVWLHNIVVDLGCLAHHCIVLASVLADQTLRCRVDHIALDSTKLFWQIIPELAILIVVEVLLWRRNSSLFSIIAPVAFLHYREE